MTAQLSLSQRLVQLRGCQEQLKLARRELERKGIGGDPLGASALRRIVTVLEQLTEDAMRYGCEQAKKGC